MSTSDKFVLMLLFSRGAFIDDDGYSTLPTSEEGLPMARKTIRKRANSWCAPKTKRCRGSLRRALSDTAINFCKILNYTLYLKIYIISVNSMDVATLLHNLRYPVEEFEEQNNDENVTKSLYEDEANECN